MTTPLEALEALAEAGRSATREAAVGVFAARGDRAAEEAALLRFAGALFGELGSPPKRTLSPIERGDAIVGVIEREAQCQR